LRSEPEQIAPQPDVEAILDLRQALAMLPARQRATVVLHYYCGLTVEQAAVALNCSEGTVKSQTARCLDTLRVALASHRPAAPTGVDRNDRSRPAASHLRAGRVGGVAGAAVRPGCRTSHP
jgi:hypothetical protein